MTSRERVLASLHHQEPDRVPFDLGSTLVTGITRIPYESLLSYFGAERSKIEICDIIQQLVVVDEDILQKLKVDTRGFLLKDFSSWQLQTREDKQYSYFTDAWGIIWRMPKKGGYYYDMCYHPLKNASTEDIRNYAWPDPFDHTRIEGLREKIEEKKREYPIILGSAGMSVGLLQTATWLLGFERCYSDLAGDPAFTSRLLDKIVELDMKFWEMFISEIGDNIDVILYADDFGIQDGLLMSMDMFRKYFKPRYKKIFSFIKARCSAQIFFHSCGSIYALIPDLIEIGVDILNPVQVNAANMDTKKLKRKFGGAISFWGGGIDTQRILPFGTPQEVKDEVRRRIDDLAPGGGFIFNTVHNIQPGVSPQNIMAMWETLQDFGKY